MANAERGVYTKFDTTFRLGFSLLRTKRSYHEIKEESSYQSSMISFQLIYMTDGS